MTTLLPRTEEYYESAIRFAEQNVFYRSKDEDRDNLNLGISLVIDKYVLKYGDDVKEIQNVIEFMKTSLIEKLISVISPGLYYTFRMGEVRGAPEWDYDRGDIRGLRLTLRCEILTVQENRVKVINYLESSEVEPIPSFDKQDIHIYAPPYLEVSCTSCGTAYNPIEHMQCPSCGAGRKTIQEIYHEWNVKIKDL